MSIEFHRRMLADRVRLDAFRAALARAIRPGESTVADLGAGTGILAFLARAAGAREIWLYEDGPVLALAETIAARNRIEALNFVPERSLDVASPEQVDVVVAEVLGNFAYEEGVLETLADARRFLKPGGVLIPRSIEQWAAPVTSDRFERELAIWRDVSPSLDLRDAEICSRNNMYVHAIEPADLADVAPQAWDALEFAGEYSGRRAGQARFAMRAPTAIHGFALWWTCVLVPGVELTTSPHAPRTHWDQIYLPLSRALAVEAGDTVSLAVASETGGGETGIDVRWTVSHARGGRELDAQLFDISRGFLA